MFEKIGLLAMSPPLPATTRSHLTCALADSPVSMPRVIGLMGYSIGGEFGLTGSLKSLVLLSFLAVTSVYSGSALAGAEDEFIQFLASQGFKRTHETLPIFARPGSLTQLPVEMRLNYFSGSGKITVAATKYGVRMEGGLPVLNAEIGLPTQIMNQEEALLAGISCYTHEIGTHAEQMMRTPWGRHALRQEINYIRESTVLEKLLNKFGGGQNYSTGRINWGRTPEALQEKYWSISSKVGVNQYELAAFEGKGVYTEAFEKFSGAQMLMEIEAHGNTANFAHNAEFKKAFEELMAIRNSGNLTMTEVRRARTLLKSTVSKLGSSYSHLGSGRARAHALRWLLRKP